MVGWYAGGRERGKEGRRHEAHFPEEMAFMAFIAFTPFSHEAEQEPAFQVRGLHVDLDRLIWLTHPLLYVSVESKKFIDIKIIKIILTLDVNIKLNYFVFFCTIPTYGDLPNPNLSAMILLCRVHTIQS